MERVILLGDLVSRVQAHFAPRLTEVEFYEDWSGIDYIRVQNPDGTFELFQFDTSPTANEVIFDVLAATNIVGVTGFEIGVDRHVISVRAREEKLIEIARKYGLPQNSTPADWRSTDASLGEIATAEWEQWFDFHQPVRLLP